MKPALFFGAVFIYLVGLFIVSTGQAETLECNSSTVLELIVNEDCPNCPPPPKCPPVLACPIGESCQLDEVKPPPGGEKQQYPPERAAAWVASLGCSNLTDVPLDDSRWGERQEGKVYAQEGEGCLSLYWPTGGSALFDLSSVVTNPARWNDYLLSDNRPPHGGGYTIGTGKEAIRFNDGGTGGMTVFTSEDSRPPPPPPTGDFLGNYTNPKQGKFPVGVYYPKGQEFWATQYSAYGSYFENAKTAGLGGVYYHDPKKLPNYWESYSRAGMQSVFHLRQSGDNNWGRILRDMKIPATKKVLADRIKEIINQVQANPELDAAVFAWYGREEMIYRPTTPLAEQQAYGKMMLDIIAATDKKKRPLYISERGDTALGTMKQNICVMDGSMKQNYLIKKEGYGFGDTAIRVLIHQWAQDTVDAARHGDKNCPSITGLPKAAIPTLSAYIDPDKVSEQNATWLRKTLTYDVFVSMTVPGVTGLSAYAYNNTSAKTGKIQRQLYNELIGFLSKSGVGRAFIWGDDRKDVKVNIVSGPTTVKWKKYKTVYTAPSYFLRNIQQGNSRYLLVTNNSKENITLSFTGIPAGLKLLNMLSGIETRTSDPLTQTIEPLGVRLLKISN